ncbi:MAG: HlyD family efflux transporter periplasmic adaptor subunit [Desulfovibrio sp.]|nr:HlyD family efflux transporter periplasmic adaptor subunit [Desulfovibrio sp.]
MESPKPNNSGPQVRRDAHRLDGLVKALCDAGGHEQRLQTLCEIACEALGAVGLAILARQQGNVSIVMASPAVEPQAEPPAWLLALGKCYGQMLAETGQTVSLGPETGGAWGVFVPLLAAEGTSITVAAYVLGGRPVRLQGVADVLQLVRSALYLAELAGQQGSAQRTVEAEGDGHNYLLDVVEVLGEVQACTRFFEAASTLCAQVARKFNCRRAALGRVRNGQIKAVALDQMESFARGTRGVRQMEEAMQEAQDQDRMVLYSAEEGEQPDPQTITRAARELATTSGARRVLSLPLRAQQGQGFVLLLVMDGASFEPQRLDALMLICRLAAPRLSDLELAEEFPLKKAWQYCLTCSADIFGPRRTGLKLATALVGLFLVLSLLISGPVVVVAPLTVEGVHSYTHTASTDSYLHEVLVRPGDEVKKGDVLGRLDTAEVGLEIAALEAQRDIHKNQAGQYLQEGKDAEAAIARLEGERAELNLNWARQRLHMMELRSSVDGFVVSEDMLPRLGQPVRRGQELFEVTDTASLRVVAHVNEEDVSDISRSMSKGEVKGEFTLTAYPDLHMPFTVERIHPFATVAGTENGFEVRGRIDASSALTLRPGMEGHARITAGEASLLSLWTRKAVNKLRLIMWRWL